MIYSLNILIKVFIVKYLGCNMFKGRINKIILEKIWYVEGKFFFKGKKDYVDVIELRNIVSSYYLKFWKILVRVSIEFTEILKFFFK